MSHARIAAFRSSFVAQLAGLALVLSTTALASAQTPVTYGAVITEPGVYFLAGNQTGSGSTGITIASDDVTLFLSRFTLRGDRIYNGIQSIDNDNVTIWGGRVTNFANGIVFAGGERCTVKDIRLDHCRSMGLIAVQVRNSWFTRLRADNNDVHGVMASDCFDCRFVSVLAHDNEFNGILLNFNEGLAGLGTVAGNKVRQCWAAYNGLDGIRVFSSDNHELVGNECVANAGAGIHLATFDAGPTLAGAGTPGPSQITVRGNWCVFNRVGIAVDDGAEDNTLTNNTALANSADDLVDDNPEPPCENTWFLNFFLTKDGAGEDCIF